MTKGIKKQQLYISIIPLLIITCRYVNPGKPCTTVRTVHRMVLEDDTVCYEPLIKVDNRH